ncbi:MAG: aldo/keto reductase [Acidobacteria bacterium]|nr:aldo/keto reductase [Acidobacteriota bacterium]
MELRQLSHTELTVSRLCVGTMTMGSQVNESDTAHLLGAAFDAGVNFVDTANVYNQGLSEELLGRCLRGKRQNVVLASKGFGKMGVPVQYSGLSREALERALDDSLRRLQTEYLDVYYLHQPDPATPAEESLEALDAFRRAGKIRYGAVSNYASWQIAEMFALSDKKGWQPPSISQPMYNLLARGIEQEYVPFARRYGVSLVVYNPLAGGLLTGKQSLESGPIAGTRFDGNQQYLGRYWHEAYFRAVEDLKKLSADSGRSLLEIAFRWLLDQDHVDSVILGASKLEHLQANLRAAASAPLSEDIRRECDRIWMELRGPTPFYNR